MRGRTRLRCAHEFTATEFVERPVNHWLWLNRWPFTTYFAGDCFGAIGAQVLLITPPARVSSRKGSASRCR